MTQTSENTQEDFDPELSDTSGGRLKPQDDGSTEELSRVPPVAQKVSRFGNQGASKFGKGATSFNPPNKQRPGRAAGRGR